MGTDRTLTLSFLGPPSVEKDGAGLRLDRRKVIGLLAYLAVTGTRQSRDKLSEVFYPGLDRERAYSDLRQTLSHLRSAIGEQWLDSDRDGVAIHRQDGLWIDVEEFRRLARGGKAGTEDATRRAAALVRGPFLSGFYLNSPEFEEWQAAQSEGLRREETLVLERLLKVHEDRGEYAEAIELGRRLLALDPLEEGFHRRLMLLCALAGQRPAALAQYKRCRALLQKELGIEPSRETEDLRRRIADGTLRAAKVNQGQRPVPLRAASPDFVGRRDELGRIAAAFQGSAGGRGRLVVVVGEAGIGKTRLLEEATSAWRGEGIGVLWGRSHDDRGLPPYWAWRQALRDLSKGEADERLRRWAGGRAPVLVELVDDLRGPLGNPPPPPRLDNPESERFRTAEAVALFLEAAAAERRLVVVLEDLHWADPATLGLLEFVARGMEHSSLLILGSCREVDQEHPLAQTLGELSRERGFERLDLRPLEPEEVTALAELSSRGPVTKSLGDLLWDKTRGNPLFVVEYVRSISAEDGPDPQSTIPSTIRAVIGRRLAYLSGECHRAMQVAAAFGGEFAADLLAQALDIPAVPLMALLDEAVAARILLEPSDLGAAFRFSHPLVHETLVSELTGGARAQVHARIADCLEVRFGEQSERIASELAAHFALAQPLAPLSKLSRYSLLAGERCLAAQTHGDALRHFRVGLQTKAPDSSDSETAWLRFGLARALCPLGAVPHHPYELGETDEALRAITSAYDAFEAAGDMGAAAQVAEHPIVHLEAGTGRIHGLYDRALPRLSPDSIEAGRLLVMKGTVSYYALGDYATAAQAFERADAIARSHGDLRLELRAATQLAVHALDHGTPEAAWEFVRRCDELLRKVDDPVFEGEIRLRSYHLCLGAGDMKSARAYIDAYAHAVARLRSYSQAEGSGMLNLMEMEFAWIQGDWGAARKASDQALQTKGGHPWITRHHMALRAFLELELGNLEEGESHLDRFLFALDNDNPLPGEFALYAGDLAWIARATGKRKLLGRVRALVGAVPRDFDYPGVLGLVAAIDADRETAQRCRAAVENWRPGELPGMGPSRLELLGLLARTVGDLDAAVPHLEGAAARHRSAGLKPPLARCLCEYAETLFARNRRGDRERALGARREALGIAKALGMKLLSDRIRLLGHGAKGA